MNERNRGRPSLPNDVREANRKNSKNKFKVMSIDADLVEALNSMADSLGNRFGFRPTLSQTLRHLIKQYKVEE